MTDPIEHLLRDHRDIMAQVADLRRAVRDLAERGDAALARALPALAKISHMMATQLARHAAKEEEALFPALEKCFGGMGGPTAVMREEHEAIHAGAARFRETLRELGDVERPAIVKAGADAGRLATGSASAEELHAVGAEIVRLLDLHFAKEEQILFPMALEMLDPDALAEVARRMEEIEARPRA